MAVIIALGALVLLVLSGTLDPLQSGALTLLPALAVAAVMILRPYAGERVIARLRARRLCLPRTRPAAPRPRPAATGIARGGRLIAAALAGRAPPLALAGSR